MSYISDGPVRRSNSTRIPPSYTNSLSRQRLDSIPASKSQGIQSIQEPNNNTTETPFANRSSILDHTHATNQSVKLGQMSPTMPDREDTSRTRSFFDDSSLNSNPAASKLSVRRANGQRAESESVTSMRKNQTKQLARLTSPTRSADNESDHLEWGIEGSSNTQKGGKPSKIPFANVRRIFRTRSKSQSAPSKASLVNDKANTIKEVEEPISNDSLMQDSKAFPIVKSPSNKSVALSTNQRRSRDMSGKHSSFFGFGRAKTPPRSKVDLEGVEAEITRMASPGKKQAQLFPANDKKIDKDAGETQDTVGSFSNPEADNTGISGLPPSSDGVPPKVFGASDTQARKDRTLTLQSLSPNLGRGGSLPGSPSVTPKKMTTDLQQLSGRGSQTTGTPTPTNAPGSRGRMLSEEEKGTFDKNASPSSLVPRIWQVSRNSRSSLVDDSPTHDQFYSKQRYGSSATSGSASSFKTAPSSFRDGVTPDPMYPIKEKLSVSTKSTFDSIKSIPRAAPSPLSELIENLEQRISSSSTPVSTPKNRELSLDKDAKMQDGNRSQPIRKQQATVQFPSSTHDTSFSTSIDDDQDESNFSHISQETPSALTPKRNTFGGDVYDRSGADKSPYLDVHSEFGHVRRDVSMQDIETSLAAVEAALHDHIVEGSMDANVLRQHILSPYNAGNISTGSFSVFNASNAGVDEMEQAGLDEDARLARITLPPEQHTAIVNAVRQVRKAISSSQLPQIPNEEDSDVSRSPQFEIVPAIVSPNRTNGKLTNERKASNDLLTSPSNAQQFSLQNQRSPALRESTPMRAARVRQESMQDVEQAYARMIELVRSAAGIDLIPSPMPLNRTFSGRRSTLSQPTPASQSANEPYEPRSSALSYVEAAQESPSQKLSKQSYVRERTQSAAPTPFSYQQIQRQNLAELTDQNDQPVVPPLPPISATSSRSARQQLLRDSDALSRYMGPLPDLSEETSDSALRGRSSNVSLGSFGSRRAASSSPPRLYTKLSSVPAEEHTRSLLNGPKDKDVSQLPRKFDIPVEPVQYTGIGSSSATGSGGGTGSGTSPSITVKTQGTPRLPDIENHTNGEGRPTHVRSTSQQVQDWQMRSRFSSPSSTRFPTEQQSKRTSAASNDSSSVAAGIRSMALTGKQIEEQLQYRRTRNHIASQGSGSGGGGVGNGSIATHAHTHSNSFTGGNQSPALVSVNGGASVHNPESISGSYRRSGSIRDWGRLEDLHYSSIRPASGASGSLAQFTKSYHSARGGFENSEASETARLALLNGRIASPSSSVSALQRRHALERDSLLDMLDRTRTEALDVRSRNEQLQSDLHQEVTRVLELQREVERQREREEELNKRVQALEDELKAEHADRVRIGELLERVQRAVDDAANARNAVRRSHDNDDDDDDENDATADETMEIVNGYDHDSPSRHHDVGTTMDRNQSNEEDPKRANATSPTSSSSVSILQEDLFPIKRRVFDPIHIEDEYMGTRQEGRRMQHISGMEPIMSSSTIDQIEALQSEQQGQQNYTDNEEDEQENDPNNTMNPAMFERSRSPSLRSYPSALGLRSVNEQEMGWSLDKEQPLQFSHESASPPDDNEKLNEISESDRQHIQAEEDAQSHGDIINTAHTISSEDGSFAEDGSRPSVFRKRASEQGLSKLPVLSKSVTGMSKSTSGTSTIVPSVSTSSSLVLDGKGRYPTFNPVNVRSRLAERFGGGKDMLNASISSSSSSNAARSERGMEDIKSNQSSPSNHSIRFPSQSSRTTGGDTSYSAQTVSPIGSFIPTFPTMSSGVRKTSNNTNRSISGGSGIPTFNGNTNIRSPISSPSRSKLHAGHTPMAKKVNHANINPIGDFSSSSAMRSAGGYYDTRRPAGYDPVDSSVLDVLSGDDSANA